MTELTIEEIAVLASVSRSTVSRVLNNHPNVRASVRDRVLRVIEENGYAPRAAARSLASQRTNVVGLLIPRTASIIFSDPFFPQVIQGITEACSSLGYVLMLSMLSSEMEQNFYNRFLRSRHFDGLIMLSSDIDDPILPLLIKDGTPLVLVGRHPYFDNLSWVDVENREGARGAVAHLVGLGHRRIATISGPLRMAGAIDRRDGYKQGMLEAGLPITPELMIEGDYTQESGYYGVKRLLALPQPPTAIFVASDAMAIGALRATYEAGLSVPRDIAIMGFDDLPIASFATPPLTSVHQPVYEMGAGAARLLIERLEGGNSEPKHLTLPTTLIVRQSCGAQLAAFKPSDKVGK